MKKMESSDEKVNKVLASLHKEQEKEPEASVPVWLHEKEMFRLELLNRRICYLALAGWMISVIYILIDLAAKLVK